jgi:Tol biopolymer transport system component
MAVSSKLVRVPFDLETHEESGEAEVLFEMPRRMWLPELSPEGARIAFTTAGMGQEDVFLINADGSGHRALTNDAPKDRHVRWSPDGNRISFYSRRGGDSWDLWTVAPSSGELVQLTDDPSDSILYSVWSPDGSQMASEYTGEHRAFLFDPNTPWGEQEPDFLPEMPGGRRFNPWEWSPDGRWIAGVSWNPDLTYRDRVAVYSPETDTFRSLSESANHDAGTDWFSTPSGWRLVYESVSGWMEWDPATDKESPLSGPPPLRRNRSPDGRWQYGIEEAWAADLWLLTFPLPDSDRRQ